MASAGGPRAILRAQGATREFRTGSTVVRALWDATLEIEQARLVLLQGPSGSGKTTLINLLGALDHPTRGEIYFDGAPLHSLSEPRRDELRRSRMGFVFQSVGLISLMSAYENVELGLRIAGYDARDRSARAERCLAFVGLARRMHHRPSELSGGEQQRVAIARAIAHRPKVIFADEPTAELDTAMGLQVIARFKALVAEEGVTVVLSSHDPAIADFADTVIALEDGRVTRVG
ncbi:MAG TPA: ABC transporter ATP-binding protein [Spirochaetia bacterium]|nr:ABC transporter ATP-binding protein [Spirochaetia bacterium]